MRSWSVSPPSSSAPAAHARRTPSIPRRGCCCASASGTKWLPERCSPSCTPRPRRAWMPARAACAPPWPSARSLASAPWSWSESRRRVARMRILYGVVGEGMGHAIRSRVVLDELVQRHDVQVVVSGRAHDYLAKRASDHTQVQMIWVCSIVTEDNEVRSFRTLLQNVRGAVTGGWPRNVCAYFDLAREFQPEVVISDFESWSYLFAVNHRLPVISLVNIQIVNRWRHAPQSLP